MAKKRGQGEGCIFGGRADGRYCASLSLGFKQNGKRDRKWFYGATESEVREKLLKARSDHSRGMPIAVSDRQTLKEFLNRWLEDVVKPEVRTLTYQQYHQHVRLYLNPTPQHVQAFINTRLKSDTRLKTRVSPRTVQLSLVILRHALNTAVKWNLMARNVAELVNSPRVPHREIKPLFLRAGPAGGGTRDSVRASYGTLVP